MKNMIFAAMLLLGLGFAYPTMMPDSGETAKVIPWCGTNQLKWSDFKGKPSPLHGHYAVTAYEVSFDVSMKNNELEFTVNCDFNPNKSWAIKKALGNDYLLRHEQLHFDLAEVYARKMRKDLAEADITVKNLQQKADEIYEKNWNELQAMQIQYDKESNHSIIEDAQAKWDKRIRQMLIDTEANATCKQP